MKPICIESSKLQGLLALPTSKSLAHRAIICASLSKGVSVIGDVSMSKDIEATIGCMRALGAHIVVKGSTVTIEGLSSFSKEAEMNCEESGSTLRFMVPLACVKGTKTHFTGKGQLGKRPLDIYYDIFDRKGISYSYKKDVLDLHVEGTLTPGTFHMRGDVSSQFITGLLFALPLLEGESHIVITTKLESKAYIDLTLQMLEHFGITIINENYERFIIPPHQQYHAAIYNVEADFSQSAFFLVADAIGHDITLTNMNLSSRQGDRDIIPILERMGAKLIKTDEGYKMEAEELKATTIDASQVPDIIPALGVACAFAKGTSHIINAQRLRIKECDRLEATRIMLETCGVQVKETEDSLTIVGQDSLHGGKLTSFNDHRMAMSEAILATRLTSPLEIDDALCVRKSYPHFFEDYKKLGGQYHEC